MKKDYSLFRSKGESNEAQKRTFIDEMANLQIHSQRKYNKYVTIVDNISWKERFSPKDSIQQLLICVQTKEKRLLIDIGCIS